MTESNEVPDPSQGSEESFGDLLSQFEQSHSRKTNDAGKQISGAVIAVSADLVFVDIGFKMEGVLPLVALGTGAATVCPGDTVSVSVKGRNLEGYYDLSLARIEQPKDWDAMEKAFAEKSTILGTVTAVVKGGLTVDVGLRAFMPASRSGARDAAEMEALVGQEIRCRITKVDVADEDVVVDRRIVSEEEDRSTKERRYSEVKAGDVMQGTVRTIMDYGAFVDLGGVDGLLHVGEIAWARVTKPEDVLSVGERIEVSVLKVEPESRRISLSMKQLQPHPWASVPDKYKVGDRVRGTVTRVTDFGAFLEIEPGVEGMIHISEMSWVKKVRKPSDLVKAGDAVEAVILGINIAEHRLSLGLKQAMGNPWAGAAERFPVGSIVAGPVSGFTTFGAFVELADGITGMVHISEITSEKRLNRPQEVLHSGQVVKAKVLAVDQEKRQLRLSIKQMALTSLEDFLAEHQEGDLVTGRIVDISGNAATVELGEGIVGTCAVVPDATKMQQPAEGSKVDLSSFSSMLSARWKGLSTGPTGSTGTVHKPEALHSGQIRSFHINRLDRAGQSIELRLA
ncbi:MAG: 30S ribosomal protein S1 [Acidobacteriaceae bacterium]